MAEGTLDITITGQVTGETTSGLRDLDNNQYNTVIIGSQEWCIENFRCTKFADGTTIPLVTNAANWEALSTAAMCWYNNDVNYKEPYGALYNWFNTLTGTQITYGALYNWYAATYNTGGASIAPIGWHLPSKAEWLTLINTLGGNNSGGSMKEAGLVHWTTPNTGATNSSGLGIIGAGSRSALSGVFELIGTNACGWLSDTPVAGNAIVWEVLYNSLTVFPNNSSYGYDLYTRGCTIRLIKDDSTNTGTVTDYDGNIYPTVKIGSQVWMAKNLQTTHYNNGTLIPNVTSDTAWAALVTAGMCYYDNGGSGATVGPYDLAYLLKDGVQQTGWRIPTNADLLALATYLGGDNVSGGKLKETGLAHWRDPNTDATNSSGFTALGSGIRTDEGDFYYLNEVNFFWPSDEYDSSRAYYMALNYNDGVQIDGTVYIDKRYGFSVRLVRDHDPDPEEPPIPQPPYQVSNVPEYWFYISEASSVTYEVFPLNFLSTTLVDELESGKMFYRRKFSGSLTFGTNSRAIDFEGNPHNRCEDFDFFWNIEQNNPCERLYLDIYKVVNGVVDLYWTGYFSTTDGRWDLDRDTFEVTPLANDDYTLILDEADTQYDILLNTPEVTTNANDGTININYTHNHWLMDVIEYLALQVAPTATVSSEFFTNATNYVTGLASKTTLLTIAQKSDIKRPTATEAASYPSGNLSWNELMDILWGMFQVTWNYNPITNILNVEHVSFFPVLPVGEIDIRTQLSCVATNKYIYTKDNMPKYEEFSFTEAGNVNFIGVPIRYESDCLNPDPNSNTVQTVVNVTTDLQYIYDVGLEDPNLISDEGWVILCNEGAGPTYSVDIEVGELIPDVRLNMHLSWANLEVNYFRHNRVLIEGYINNTLTQFESSQKTRQQECTVIFCNPYSPEYNMKTELGETYFGSEKGTVKRAVIHPTGEVNLTLLYATKNYNLTPAPDPLKYIIMTMNSCTHFDAILSEDAPAGGLNITIKYAVWDETRTEVCRNVTPFDTWHIDEFTNTSSHDIVLDCAIPENGCVYYFYVYVMDGATEDLTWVISLNYFDNCGC